MRLMVRRTVHNKSSKSASLRDGAGQQVSAFIQFSRRLMRSGLTRLNGAGYENRVFFHNPQPQTAADNTSNPLRTATQR